MFGGWAGNKTTSPSFKLFQTLTSQAEKAFLNTARTVCVKQGSKLRPGAWWAEQAGPDLGWDLDKSPASCSLQCDLIYILFTSPHHWEAWRLPLATLLEWTWALRGVKFESQPSSLSSLCIRQSETGEAVHSGKGISCLWGLKTYLRGYENQGIIRNREDLERWEIKPGSTDLYSPSFCFQPFPLPFSFPEFLLGPPSHNPHTTFLVFFLKFMFIYCPWMKWFASELFALGSCLLKYSFEDTQNYLRMSSICQSWC